MEKNNIVRIIGTYLSGRFSPETEEKVQKWIIKDRDTEEKEKASLEYWDQLEAKTDPDTKLALDRVNQKIGYKKIVPRPFYQKRMSIAAALIPLLIIAGSYLYYTSTKDKWVEISVAYGDKKHFLLPDSSEIWLNAGTAIKYPEKFSKAQRLVYLDGEAYFSVRKDAAKPFIVETSQLSVKVLGTQFNVKAYADDELVTTTLTSGKVEVTPPVQGSQILKPNEQLTYDKKTSAVNITEVSPTDADGWITGKLIFTDAPFILSFIFPLLSYIVDLYRLSSVRSSPVNSPVILPAFMIRARSHNAVISATSSDTTSTAMPCFASSRSNLWISYFAPISTPTVGPFKIRILGCVASHLARTTFC